MRTAWKMAGLGVVLLLLFGGPAVAVTDIMEGAEVQADPEALKAVLAAFNRAEEALRTKNLSGITAVYSKNYQNRGLRKEETSRIWKDIFTRYDRLSSRHLFTKIVVDREKGTARVTCTGALFGVSILKQGRPSPTATEEPTHIDVWFEADHHLVLEDGDWKIIGHDPARGADDPFGAAIHLLF
ncbi:MAG: hypothetical protein HY204_04730 [Nitrospirae bacterium]|nr:hypothetical protein [Nitrospirota bacterium]